MAGWKLSVIAGNSTLAERPLELYVGDGRSSTAAGTNHLSFSRN